MGVCVLLGVILPVAYGVRGYRPARRMNAQDIVDFLRRLAPSNNKRLITLRIVPTAHLA